MVQLLDQRNRKHWVDVLSRVSAVKSILDVLKREILATMRPGDLLPNERSLAERFGVGRNTIREAMIFLEAYGLVEKTQRGPRVTDAERSFAHVFSTFDSGFDRSLATYRDLIEFRRHLELGILDRVFANITDDGIAELDAIVDRMAHTLTSSEAAALDYDFHAKMIEISGNSVLQRLYKVMGSTLTYYMEIGKPKHAEETVVRHRQIVDALRRRSRQDLEAMALRHFDYSEQVLNTEFTD
jgi:GntR family transcriptional regulator, transcriptional repressor for pyruvate dehydrogenase complex